MSRIRIRGRSYAIRSGEAGVATNVDPVAEQVASLLSGSRSLIRDIVHQLEVERQQGVDIEQRLRTLDTKQPTTVSEVRAETDPLRLLIAFHNPRFHGDFSLLSNPNLPGWFVTEMVYSEKRSTALIALHNPALPLEAMEALALDKDAVRRSHLASNPALPEHLLRRLAGDPDVWVRTEIARREDIPPDISVQLAQDSEVEVTEYIAANEHSDPEAFRLLMSGSVRTRQILANNRALPPELAIEIVEGDAWEPIRNLSRNQALLSAPVLRAMAGHRLAQVREWAASNEHCPADVLVALAADVHQSVRMAVAWNEKVPDQALRLLLKDEDKHVQRNLAARLGHLRPLPDWALWELAEVSDPLARATLARAGNLPMELIRKLGQDRSKDVRAAVAMRKDCPLELLERMREDASGIVRSQARMRTDGAGVTL